MEDWPGDPFTAYSTGAQQQMTAQADKLFESDCVAARLLLSPLLMQK